MKSSSNQIKLVKTILSLLIAAALVSHSNINAQNAEPAQEKKQVQENSQAPENFLLMGLEQLIKLKVSGIREVITHSVIAKRNAVGITDSIYAEDFNKFPDLNIAESIQRVPGVTLNRNRGEGDQVNIRGLSPEFTRVEVLGMASTTSQTDRDFRFDLFPSELFNEVVIHKSASADLIEGGLAALVKMDTPKPLNVDIDTENNGLKTSVAILGLYTELTENTKPRASFQLAKNWHNKYGLAFGFAYAESENVSHRADSSNWNQPMSDRIAVADQAGLTEEELAAWLPRTPRYVVDDSQRERLGSTFTFQSQLSNELKLTYDALYVNLREDHQLIKNDVEFENNIGVPTDLVIENGIVTAGTFAQIAPRVTNELFASEDKVTQHVLKLDGTLSKNWTFKTQLGHSQAEQQLNRVLHGFAATQGSIDNSASGNLDGDIPITLEHMGNFVNFTSAEANFGIFDIDDYEYLVYLFRDSVNKDDNWSARFDTQYSFQNQSTLELGVRYDERTKSRVEARGEVGADDRVGGGSFPDLNAPGLASLIDYNGPGPVSQIISVNLDASNALILSLFPENIMSPRPRSSFEVGEKTLATYIKGNLETRIFNDRLLQGNAGLRLVRTESASSGTIEDTSGGASDMPITIDNTYTKLLPSFNLKLDAMEEVVLRTALYRTLARPSLTDMSPAVRVDLGTQVGSAGNPEIQPFTAWNTDIAVEWYFGEPEDAGLASVTYSHKDIESLVENITEDVTLITCPQIGCDANTPPGPRVFQITRPVNGNAASVKSLELALQSNFSFLPAPFNDLGGILNFTKTDSSASFTNEADVRSIQLPGLSRNSLNAILYYQHGKKFEARLAYAWRDKYIRELRNPGLWRDAYAQLDFSASYNYGKLSFQLEVLNLTNSKVFEFADNNTDLPTRYGEWGRKFVFGARYNF